MILTSSQILTLIQKVGFPAADQAIMVAIAFAESGGNTQALNTSNSNGSSDRGLFQINSIHGYNATSLMDGEFNARAALDIYRTQGLEAWSAYNNGSYLKHLDAARAQQSQPGTAGVDKAEPPGGYQYKIEMTPVYRHICRSNFLDPSLGGVDGALPQAYDETTGQFGSVPPPPGPVGVGGVGVSSINQLVAIMAASGVPHRVTSTYRSTSTTYHGSYNAADFGGPTPGVDTPDLARVAAFWATYGPGLLELIYSGPGAQYWKNGVRVASSVFAAVLDIHHNHVHTAATLDSLSKAYTTLPANDPSANTYIDSSPAARGSADVFTLGDNKITTYEGSRFASGFLGAY